MTIAEALIELRSSSLSKYEKGKRFEHLIQSWLLADPLYSAELDNVWLWEQFPAKDQFGDHDLGIDLVARTKLGEYWAIQCKFYAQEARIDKGEVDSFISNSSRSFTDPFTGNPTQFAARFWVSTSDYFNDNALEIIRNQLIPFHRITLDHLARSPVDWQALLEGKPEKRPQKEPMEHQKLALTKSHAHFQHYERGKLIMACGTGKSYTACLIAGEEVKQKGAILCLVPSISLVNQFLNGWMADTEMPTYAICICSDAKASRKKNSDENSGDVTDLALPATTNANEIARRYLAYTKKLENEDKGHIVVFSTYQSIDQVAKAQESISEALGRKHEFDLIICDEAHRTTGIIKPETGKPDFTKIHDNDFIRGKKRLYMTATPRLYADNVKARVKQSDYELCSMDDEKLYGKEIHNVSFGYAVSQGLLTDYKVLVLTVGSEHQLPEDIRKEVENPDKKELDFDLASKLVGCINGLAKNTTLKDNQLVWEADPRIMKRAIAFCPNINKNGDPASSVNTSLRLPEIARDLYKDKNCPEHKIRLQARHIDGSMDAATRANHLAWLAQDTPNSDECRVLCNVRCLSEGIDVPALDAAIFLSPRSSQVDVVQAVGRVMRNFRKGHADAKKFGYIIIPVVVNPNVPAEEALNDNESFATVWKILNALRSHDERFEAMINSIALNKKKPLDKIVVDHTKLYGIEEEDSGGNPLGIEENQAYWDSELKRQLSLFSSLDEKLYAKMVEKVGSRLYWERWARDIAPLARNLIGRITELVAMPGEVKERFQEFVQALQKAINDSIDERQAIEMLGQHMITRPVFEALFADYSFNVNNAVTRAMAAMVDLLLEHGLAKDTAKLDEFYQSVKRNLGEVTTLSGKQTVIKNLYDSFFKGAFPKAVEQLGIVYTPVECVDFILHSVDAVLRKEFGIGLTDREVHILDPFTGTGTFITRLLQSGLIKPEDMERKYLSEIHCNELVLLAYYVADVNIESVFHDKSGRKEYLPFNGICLTDTFELAPGEKESLLFPPILKGNFESMEKEQKARIRVIIGNPPYSAGQKSGNDNAQNLKYPALDKRIEQTYVANEKGVNKKNLYDSYIRAFRWASDRLKATNEGGVIGFVTNSKWLDGNASAGFRECLESEFSRIYVFDLKGSVRAKTGELARKEGGNVFNILTGVCLVILVYDPQHKGKASIQYCDIGDYLTREQKLKILSERRNIFDKKMHWQEIMSDDYGDWLKQRSDLFGGFIVIGDKKDKNNKETWFAPFYSNGVKTQRDAWCWNYSRTRLEENIKRTIEFYNGQCEQVAQGKEISRRAQFFSWSANPETWVFQNKKMSFEEGNVTEGSYRPFSMRNLYFSRQLNERVYQIPQLFPNAASENKVICVNGTGGKKDFSCIITDKIPDLELVEKSQCFPCYYYEQKANQQGNLFGDTTQYQRKDGITDWILKNIRGRFGNARAITKETIFYYVYGILHSPEYRKRFNDDLKKSLPRIPIADSVEDFIEFSEAGRKLANLHLNYENTPPCETVQVTGTEKNNFIVQKMKFAGRQGAWDKSRIIYNSDIGIGNIPLRAYDYVVNGRSAIEWIMESYQVKVDKDSGIKNDPNDWAKEHDKPRYILDLLLSVITVSLETMKIVDGLPKLYFET